MRRNREQLLQVIGASASELRLLAERCQQHEEQVKQTIEVNLAALRAATYPATPEILTALGLPFNVSERAWRAARKVRMTALRDVLMELLRSTRELRQAERDSQRKLEGLRTTIAGVTGGPALAEANALMEDIEAMGAALGTTERGLTQIIAELHSIAAPAPGERTATEGGAP